jgi:hypothetical protein
MSKARIVEIEYPDGRTAYRIQQRHWLFKWKWVSAWINSPLGAMCDDTFYTLEEAKENLCYFDGTPATIKMLESEECE